MANSKWQRQYGYISGNLNLNKDSKELTLSAAGELVQKFIARNSLTETVVSKMVYAMHPQTLPYFDVTANEIVRVGDLGTVTVALKNGYTGSCEITVKAYKENEDAVNEHLIKLVDLLLTINMVLVVLSPKRLNVVFMT